MYNRKVKYQSNWKRKFKNKNSFSFVYKSSTVEWPITRWPPELVTAVYNGEVRSGVLHFDTWQSYKTFLLPRRWDSSLSWRRADDLQRPFWRDNDGVAVLQSGPSGSAQTRFRLYLTREAKCPQNLISCFKWSLLYHSQMKNIQQQATTEGRNFKRDLFLFVCLIIFKGGSRHFW